MAEIKGGPEESLKRLNTIVDKVFLLK